MSTIQTQSASARFIDVLERIPRRIGRALRKQLYKPSLTPIAHQYSLIRLGTKYGGWTFADLNSLHRATVISCGLGEDASFDIALASRFDCKVVLVDPTPKAIAHFNEISGRYGSRSAAAYTTGGKQPVEAYDLTKLGSHNLQLVDKALWTEATTLKFFKPRDPTHVSHSIVNFQNDYRQDSDHIEVAAVAIDGLLELLGIAEIPLIKLDIEGAEIEVLIDMMKKKIFPDQILVEYDELARPSKLSRDRINSGHASLLQNGYALINIETPSNFLYVRTSVVSSK